MKENPKAHQSTPYTLIYTPNESPDTINPFLVVFPYNFPKLSTINDSDEVQWQLGENKERKLKSDKSLIGISPKIQYEARSKPNLNRSDYVLGFLHKKSQRTIAVYDIDGIFPMNQKILKTGHETSKRLPIEEHTYASDKQELMEQFGTSKAKKLASNMKTNVVDESNISSVQNAKYILQQKAMDKDTLFNADEIKKNQLFYMKEILPAFDTETTDVRKIFDFESIIENEAVVAIDHKPVLKMLKGNGKELNKNKELFTELAFDYLRGLIPKINEGKNLSNKIKYSIYINELIVFYLLPKTIRETPEKLAEAHKIELAHVKSMLGKYAKQTVDSTGRASYVRSPTLLLKNVYHILVLALLLNGYEFNYTSLAKSMRLEMKKVMSFYKELGCSFKTEKTAVKSTEAPTMKNTLDIVKLNAPLKLNLTYNKFSKRK